MGERIDSRHWLPEEIEESLDEIPEFHRAFLYLNDTIMETNKKLDYLISLVPLRYKKFNPNKEENPFFCLDDIKLDPKEYEEAKKRMADLLEKNK